MRYYTVQDFETAISDPRYKRVVIVRNGDSVGLYRYDQKKRQLVRYRKIVDAPYGRQKTFNLQASGEYWGGGGTNGISAVVPANEAHLIPKRFKLNNPAHLSALNISLGGNYVEVRERIAKANLIPKEGKTDATRN